MRISGIKVRNEGPKKKISVFVVFVSVAVLVYIPTFFWLLIVVVVIVIDVLYASLLEVGIVFDSSVAVGIAGWFLLLAVISTFIGFCLTMANAEAGSAATVFAAPCHDAPHTWHDS